MITFRTNTSRTLSYHRRGDGPLVVMLPGGPGLDPETYFANSGLQGLSALVFCPRGTGRSDPPPTPEGYRMAGYVEDVEELRLHLGVPTLTLYGSSHGASTALAYACLLSERPVTARRCPNLALATASGKTTPVYRDPLI